MPRFTRSLLMTGILLLPSAVACGGGDSDTQATAGVAGSTSSGGSGVGGSSASGGTAGGAVGGSSGAAARGGTGGASAGSGGSSSGEGGVGDNTGGTAGSSGGTGGSAGTGGGHPPMSADGFTQYKPSADTIVYYVAADGDDSNAGTSEDAPLLTAAAALKKVRDGFPDWILFKRGDSFLEIGQIKASGRSMAEPLLFGSYGDSTVRPRFGVTGFNTTGAGGAPEYTSFVAFQGLGFIISTRDPANPKFDPTFGGAIVNWLRGSDGIWIEDCVFQWDQVGFQEFDNFPIQNLTFYRTQFLDSYDSTGSHSQNVYISEASVVFDECLFDHGGWNASIPGAEPTIFNHNIYIQNYTPGVTLKNSISMRASSHGLQLRAGGTVENNFFYNNPIAILVGGGSTPDPGGVDATVIDNVVSEGVDMQTGDHRGWALDLANIKSMNVDGNIFTHCLGTGCQNISTDGMTTLTLGDNIINDWPGAEAQTSGNYPDPDVTLADYAATLNMSLDEFYAALRAQSQFNWKPELTATAINNYFRTAFGVPKR